MKTTTITAADLRRAADLKETIETATAELSAIFDRMGAHNQRRAFRRGRKPGRRPAAGESNGDGALVVKPRKKHKMSAAGRARISAAAKARWAKLRAQRKGAQTAKKATPKRSKFGPAARASGRQSLVVA